MRKTTITEEVNSLFMPTKAKFFTPRNREIVYRYYGFDGGIGDTMEAIGADYKLTRERVRQIIKKCCDHADSPSPRIDAILQAHDIVSKMLPASATEIESRLQKEGLINAEFKAEGVISAINIFAKKDLESRFLRLNEGRFVIPVELHELPGLIQSHAIKEVSHNGASSVTRILEHVCKGLPGIRHQFVADVVNSIPDNNWLCDGREWFFFGGTGRNRLLSRFRKIFSIATNVEINTLHDAIKRCWRKSVKDITYVLPTNIMLEVARKTERLLVNNDGIISVSRPYDPSEELNSMEIDVFNYIKNSPTEFRREKEMEDELVKNDGDKFAFSMAINYSPIISRIEWGKYGLIGQPI